jgi:hypothetical protein
VQLPAKIRKSVGQRSKYARKAFAQRAKIAFPDQARRLLRALKANRASDELDSNDSGSRESSVDGSRAQRPQAFERGRYRNRVPEWWPQEGDDQYSNDSRSFSFFSYNVSDPLLPCKPIFSESRILPSQPPLQDEIPGPDNPHRREKKQKSEWRQAFSDVGQDIQKALRGDSLHGMMLASVEAVARTLEAHLQFGPSEELYEVADALRRVKAIRLKRRMNQLTAEQQQKELKALYESIQFKKVEEQFRSMRDREREKRFKKAVVEEIDGGDSDPPDDARSLTQRSDQATT